VSRRKPSADDWRRAVFAANKLLPPASRLCLVYMADFMDSRRFVSRPRHLIAKDLGVSERSVDKFIGQAHTAGFLDTVTPGRKGVTAVYHGTFPGPQREHCVRPKKGSQREPDVRAESAQNVRAETGLSANTGFAPLVTESNGEAPCEQCADTGCADCCGWSA